MNPIPPFPPGIYYTTEEFSHEDQITKLSLAYEYSERWSAEAQQAKRNGQSGSLVVVPEYNAAAWDRWIEENELA